MSTRVLQTVDLPEAVPPATPIMKGVLKAGMDLPLVGHPVLDRSFVIPYDELVFLQFKDVSFTGGQYETISNMPDKSRTQLQREPRKLDENDYERVEVPAHSET